jgi:amino acid adenylation domain-containing protein
VTQEESNSGAVQTVEFDPFAGAAIAASFPTTEPQKEVWLSSQLGPDASCSYNESIVLELRGKLSVEALETALNNVVQRHDALRATVSADGESLLIAEDLPILLSKVDLGSLDHESAAREARLLLSAEVTTPFDLLNGPLIRACLLRWSDEHHDLIVSAHHIVCDGWSFEPLLSDLGRFYSANRSGQEAQLDEADSFQVYVDRHSDPDYADDIKTSEEYWLQRFRSIPQQSEFPPDFPRPKERSFEAHCLLHSLPTPLVDRLRKLASVHRCSLMTTLLCAFEVFVSRITGLTDLVIGVPSAGQLAFDCPRLVGHCVNLLPIRTHVERSLTFAEYLNSRRAQVLSDFDHQKFTYGSLIKSLRLERDVSRMPLTSLMFNIDQPLEGIAFEGLDFRIGSNPREYEAFEQFFNLTMEEDDATIECQYNSNLFSEPLMRHRLESFQNLLEEIAGNADQPIESINLLSARQHELVTSEWAHGPVLEPAHPTFIDAFGAAVLARPNEVACEFGDVSISYAELDSLSDTVAADLEGRGVGPGHRVGILLPRSDKLVIGILGTLKAGAAYVPLDPEFPVERLNFIVDDADLSLVLTDSNLPNDAAGQDKLVDIADVLAGDAGYAAPAATPRPEDSAYLIYTSGSTGQPKGVEIVHGNLCNFLFSMAERPGLEPGLRMLAVTSSSFDISILELLGPLAVGGTVIVADEETVKDGARMLRELESRNVGCMQATPSTWRMLKEAGWKGSQSLRVLCGGEALDGDLADWLAGCCGQVWNMYGPTETTIWSAIKKITETERPVTLGRPIHNTSTYVLDARGQPIPPGTMGQLFIGGQGVAKGYWGRSELTDSRFVANPFAAGPMYATGDLVRHLASGELEYAGRIDNQVKLHGYRIELGDVEAALQRFEGVEQAVAAVRTFAPGDARMVAYLKMKEGYNVDTAKAREFVASILPSYMVPNHVLELAEFPMTPNRKIDRRALPMPEAGRAAVKAVDNELQGETQVAVAAIWQEVLGVDAVGRRDNFFDLGGHSLLVTRVVALIRSRVGADLPFRRFFEAPVLEDVADAIGALAVLSDRRVQRPQGDELEEIEF